MDAEGSSGLIEIKKIWQINNPVNLSCIGKKVAKVTGTFRGGKPDYRASSPLPNTCRPWNLVPTEKSRRPFTVYSHFSSWAESAPPKWCARVERVAVEIESLAKAVLLMVSGTPSFAMYPAIWPADAGLGLYADGRGRAIRWVLTARRLGSARS